MHNASPYEYFIGNPNDYDSYGCYAPVIVNAVNKAVKALITIAKIQAEKALII